MEISLGGSILPHYRLKITLISNKFGISVRAKHSLIFLTRGIEQQKFGGMIDLYR